MTLIKILLLLTPILLLSCTKAPKESEYVVDISDELAQIKKDLSPNIEKENLIKLFTKSIGIKTFFF